MKINFNNCVNTFTRAFTTREQKKLDKLQSEARDKLGIKETSAIVFDFNIPSEYGKNYAIGTLNSNSALEFVNFLKKISSISKIQTAPQGELKYSKYQDKIYYTTSPYSGTTFTIGAHTIALEKLCNKEYGCILDKRYIKSLDENYPKSKLEREYKTDYDYLLGEKQDGVLFEALNIAYSNFKNTNNNKLREEFNNFKNNLQEDAKLNLIYDSKELNQSMDFLEFCQFLAFKQHMETKQKLNNNGIKYFGDCLICFSPKEVEMHPECFKKDLFTGVEDPGCPETNNIQAWWTPALNYDRLGTFDNNGEIKELDVTGKLLYSKFKNFLTLYDGIRLDAFWQYVTPFEYNSNLQGKYTENLQDKILKIIEKASIDTKGYFSADDFVLELVGYGTQEAKKLTKNIYPHIYSTAYAEFGENPNDLKENAAYQDDKFLIGAANHDNDTLVNMSRDIGKRNSHEYALKKNLKNGYNYLKYNSNSYNKKSFEEKQQQDYRTAKSAEIFTIPKQYYTLPDLFGMQDKINNTGKIDENNWKVRIPYDYEKFYYTQLSKGYGINFPKAYQVALIAKGSNNYDLINELAKASEILEQDGPMTTKEADDAEKSGKLDIML